MTLQPFSQFGDEWRGAGLPSRQPLAGSHAADLTLDAVELSDAAQAFSGDLRAVSVEHFLQLPAGIRRATRKQYTAEEKIRIVLDGLKGENSIAELCRREGIAQSLYYSWSKEFLEACKKRLAGDTARAATSSEVKDLRRDPVVATSLLDRLLHHAVVIQIEGASYRLRSHADLIPEHVRANAPITPPPPPKRRGRPPKTKTGAADH